jgi:hypothetical protein
MMRGASGDECGNLVLGQEYNRPAEAGVLKKPRGSDFKLFETHLFSVSSLLAKVATYKCTVLNPGWDLGI